MMTRPESLPSDTSWSGRRNSHHLLISYHVPPTVQSASVICHLKPPQQPYKVGTTITPILQVGKLRLGKIKVTCPRSQS